jgi:phosphoribosyl-ATP pyrophosphohydrolase
MFDKILEYAARLPSGVLDANAADKLLAEREELVAALWDGDREGALTEGADAAYYAAKHLHWVAHQLGVTIPDLFALAEAKYALRAQPGNPKDDVAERAAVCAEMRRRDV